MLELIDRYQKKATDLEYILTIVVLTIIIDSMLVHVAEVLETYVGSMNGPEVKSISMIILTCIVAPFIESLFVAGIVGIMKNKLKIRKKAVILIVTTSIFSMLHYYSIIYIIIIFPRLLLMVYSYMYYEGKKISSFSIMLIIHIVENSISILLQ